MDLHRLFPVSHPLPFIPPLRISVPFLPPLHLIFQSSAPTGPAPSRSILFASRPFRPPSGPLSDPHPAPFPLHPALPAPFLVLTCLFTPASQRPTARRPSFLMPAPSFPTPVRSLLPAHPFLYPSRTFSPPAFPSLLLDQLVAF